MHYSGDAIRRSLGHFLLGKGITAIGAVVLLLALARQLPKADFAIYATLQAMVLVVGALTSFGLNQSTLRYLPEMRAQGQNRAMYALVWRTAALRLGVTAAAFAACAAALPWLAGPLGMAEQVAWVALYLGIGALRLTAQFLSSAMEALLWPKISQYALAAAALLKLVLVVSLALTGRLDLPAVVVLEGLGDALALALLATGLRRRQRVDPQAEAGAPDWALQHRARMRHFGRWNYLTTLMTQLATSSPYRLLAPVLLGADRTALLGLVYSLADLLQRFLPARMARLLLRSVIVGRQGPTPDPAATRPPLHLSFRLNAVLLAVATACALAAGSGLLAVLTRGTYTGAGPLLAAALLVLLLDVWRMHNDLLAAVHEQVRSALWANAGLATGLLVAVQAAGELGVWALPLGAAIGQLVAIVLYGALLRELGPYRLLSPRALAYFALAGGSGMAMSMLPATVHWGTKLAAVLVACSVLAVLFRPLRWAELRPAQRPLASVQTNPPR